jgi:hypothetical protein
MKEKILAVLVVVSLVFSIFNLILMLRTNGINTITTPTIPTFTPEKVHFTFNDSSASCYYLVDCIEYRTYGSIKLIYTVTIINNSTRPLYNVRVDYVTNGTCFFVSPNDSSRTMTVYTSKTVYMYIGTTTELNVLLPYGGDIATNTYDASKVGEDDMPYFYASQNSYTITNITITDVYGLTAQP